MIRKDTVKNCKPRTSQEKKKVDKRPTNLVMLTNKVYDVEKRLEVCNVNKWDCKPGTYDTRNGMEWNEMGHTLYKLPKFIQILTVTLSSTKDTSTLQCTKSQ